MNKQQKKRKVIPPRIVTQQEELPRIVTPQEKLDYLSREGFTIEERMVNGVPRFTTIHRVDGSWGIQREYKRDFATFDDAFNHCEAVKAEEKRQVNVCIMVCIMFAVICLLFSVVLSIPPKESFFAWAWFCIFFIWFSTKRR